MNVLPDVVSRAQWLQARHALLLKEKEITRARDALNAERRRLPVVAVDKDYSFETPQGRKSLLELFEGRSQLVVYHFMFDPADPPPGQTHPYSEGCPGCSHVADNIPHLSHVHARDTAFTMVSRALLTKIAPFKQRMGWTMPWVSSFGSDFNYDFGVTIDPAVAPPEYNYQDAAALQAKGQLEHVKGELPGLSVFLRDGKRIYHSYSTFGRGLDGLLNTHNILDLTPYGRQEGWEDSPAGWPQSKDFWLRHHDKYDGQTKVAPECCQD
ncbi:DUF899 domain-containing protein [Ferrovibrio terrae]|uniref:DUF899 domain-containing protein n=1 Tax=Ferrovibrio terrae TaxID=2594003 RepID=A0A516GW86_9PROT|nr:DUF899 domain-containing protein [Ferrovibrio terrae]QDO95788.1 DUF899 domain-containing protein [Ferrovibrio terrae]